MAMIIVPLVIAAASAIVSAALAPDTSSYQVQDRGREQNLQVPRSRYGDNIPIVWGRARIPAALVWADDIREVVTTEIQSQGGKGGGGGTQTVESKTYTYFANCGFLLSDTAYAGVTVEKIRFNAEMLWDQTSTHPDIAGVTVRTYDGQDDSIDPIQESIDPENAFPYKLRSRVFFEDLPLEKFGNRLPQISADVVNFANLDTVLADLCIASKLTEDDFDVSDLIGVDLIGGVYEDKGQSAADLIKSLQKAFFFEVLDTGDRLKFTPMYRSSVQVSLPYAELGAHEYGQQRGTDFTVSELQESDLPTQVTVSYSDLDNSYLDGLSRSPIYEIGTARDQVMSLDLPMAIDDRFATKIATRLLYLAWSGRYTYKFYLPPKYLYLEPGDVLQIPFYGSPVQVKIGKLNFGANGLIEIEAVSYSGEALTLAPTIGVPYSQSATATQGTAINLSQDDPSGVYSVTNSAGTTTYTRDVDYSVNLDTGTVTPIIGGGISNGTAIKINYEAAATPDDPVIPEPSDTTLRVLDIPQVYDSDPQGLYVFADGDADWRNAALYVSRDGGTNYSYAAPIYTRTEFGSCLSVLPSGSTAGLDTVSTLDISVPAHVELASISDAELDLGLNTFLVGDEILQAKTCTLTGTSGSNRLYTLTNWRRGLRGTYGEVGAHGSSEDFYNFSGYVVKLAGSEADIGRELYFKAIAQGQALEDVDPVVLTVAGNALNAVSVAVSGFSPTQGVTGDSLKVFGKGFSNASAVSVNSTAVSSFTVDSDSQITAIVGSGTTTGAIEVTSPLGTGESEAQFFVQSGAFLSLADIETIRFYL